MDKKRIITLLIMIFINVVFFFASVQANQLYIGIIGILITTTMFVLDYMIRKKDQYSRTLKYIPLVLLAIFMYQVVETNNMIKENPVRVYFQDRTEEAITINGVDSIRFTEPEVRIEFGFSESFLLYVYRTEDMDVLDNPSIAINRINMIQPIATLFLFPAPLLIIMVLLVYLEEHGEINLLLHIGSFGFMAYVALFMMTVISNQSLSTVMYAIPIISMLLYVLYFLNHYLNAQSKVQKYIPIILTVLMFYQVTKVNNAFGNYDTVFLFSVFNMLIYAVMFMESNQANSGMMERRSLFSIILSSGGRFGNKGRNVGQFTQIESFVQEGAKSKLASEVFYNTKLESKEKNNT